MFFRSNTTWKTSLKLENADLCNFDVIGQVDTKFVAVTLKRPDDLYFLLLDQHAIDERIRLEGLIESKYFLILITLMYYFTKSTKSKQQKLQNSKNLFVFIAETRIFVQILIPLHMQFTSMSPTFSKLLSGHYATFFFFL